MSYFSYASGNEMIQRKKCSLSLILLLLVAICSCSEQSGFTSYFTLGDEGMGTEPYVFELSDQLFESKPQNFFIRLRNDNSYAFTNIFLICSLKSADEIVLQDTLEYAMAKSDGTWLGKGFTEVKESKLWWKEGIVIPKGKPLIVEISQVMRKSGNIEGITALEGIISVGISIEAQEE